MPFSRTQNQPRLRGIFIVIASVIIILSSCALGRQTGTVRLKPSALRPLPGNRPWAFVRYLPFSYKDHMVEIKAPGGGRAYLLLGPALSATYSNALGAYFSVNYISSKGTGQLAFADFDLMKFHSSIEDLEPAGQGKGRAKLTLGLTHFIRIMNREAMIIEDIPLEVSVSDVIEYSDMDGFMKGAESLTADLLLRLESQLFEHVLEKGREGLYVPYGSHTPAPINDQGPDSTPDSKIEK